MAITQISKVQIRRGLNEDLPQLSSAEMGWSTDTQQLWIGNGTLAEGAPQTGVTEILTEHSDILAVIASYTFQGASAGYIVQTGPTGNQPIVRSLQQKLDDFVNVKDFGAKGDGSTNDVAAINRALFQLYCLQQSNVAARRVLYFPAGNYIISGDVIRVPTYACLVGAGKGRTIIIQQDATQTACVKTADSLQQVDVSVGSNGATLPYLIDVSGITFSTVADQPVLSITAASSINFNTCGFSGPLVLPSSIGAGNGCINILSLTAAQVNAIEFTNCDINGLGYGCIADDDMQHITFTRCNIHDLFQGFILGKNTNGVAPALRGPTSFRITNCYFNNVYDIGLNVYALYGITSTANYYGNVANANLGSGNPTNNVISFLGGDNQSVTDVFSRNDTDNNLFARVSLNGAGGSSNSFSLPHIGQQTGVYRIGPGVATTLTDNTTGGSTGILFNVTLANSYIIEYSILRGTNARTGVITITGSSTGQTISDEYMESAASTNVTFSLSSLSGSVFSLLYTTDNEGINALFKYAVKRFTLA